MKRKFLFIASTIVMDRMGGKVKELTKDKKKDLCQKLLEKLER